MSNALDEFRAQREAAEEVHKRLTHVAQLLRSLRQETTALAQTETLRKLLQEEQTWLVRAEDLVDRVRRFREIETSRFWPAVWRRWAMAVALAVAMAAAAGAGYVWAYRPYETEVDTLRSRAELWDAVAQRVFRMTPAERRQFEGLMKWSPAADR